QRIRFFLLDDLRDRAPVDRLDVDAIGHFGIGHDRGRVRIHKHHAITLLAQRLARLRAGIVELAGLADHDRPRADDQDGVEVAAAGHQCASRIVCANFSNRYATSLGPGLASGWPWKQNAGRSVSAKPCNEPSKRETCVTRVFAGSVSGSTEKPWFCEVISTRPLSRSFTGWLAPWWPNGILRVFAPSARPINWWPRQMPNSGMRASSNSRVAAIA